nr:retrotransposon Orf1 [Tanacetum cinerariifolium]
MASQDARLSKFEVIFKQQQSEMTNKIDTVLKAITDQIAGALHSDTVKDPKMSTFLVFSARSYPSEEPQCSTHIHGSINAIAIYPKQQSDSHDDEVVESEEGEKDIPENTYTNPSASLDPSVSFIIEKVRNFTYDTDVMIIKDISNMTHDPPKGVVRFTNRTDEIAYQMPHKIEQYNSLSDLEKEHTKLVYLRNEEDKRKGVEYMMNKILGFYKECLELGPEYVTGIDDEGEVT